MADSDPANQILPRVGEWQKALSFPALFTTSETSFIYFFIYLFILNMPTRLRSNKLWLPPGLFLSLALVYIT